MERVLEAMVYQVSFIKIKEVLIPILKEVYDEIFKREETSNSMGIGVIKLIRK